MMKEESEKKALSKQQGEINLGKDVGIYQSLVLHYSKTKRQISYERFSTALHNLFETQNPALKHRVHETLKQGINHVFCSREHGGLDRTIQNLVKKDDS